MLNKYMGFIEADWLCIWVWNNPSKSLITICLGWRWRMAMWELNTHIFCGYISNVFYSIEPNHCQASIWNIWMLPFAHMLKFTSDLIVLICAHTLLHCTFRMNGDLDRHFKWENVWTRNHLCTQIHTLTRTRIIDPIADSVPLRTASEFQLWT